MMKAQNEIQSELFALLDRLAAIGRKVREKDTVNKGVNLKGLKNGDQLSFTEEDSKND